MSAAIRILIGLAAGLAVGAAISTVDQPSLRFVVPFLEPVGQLFVNAIRMTVIPLIISKLIVGIASAADAHDPPQPRDRGGSASLSSPSSARRHLASLSDPHSLNS